MTDPGDTPRDGAPAPLARLRALFEGALERAGDEREAWLRREAAGDGALLAEVRALLAAHADSRLTLDSPAALLVASAAATTDGQPAPSRVGERLGGWELVREIGAGGMGLVYEARRADAQFRKRAAVKFVRTALATPATLARFRRERQILADLEHPRIATLLDGGVTDDGAPYLVMEYVDGAPITRWCDARHLDVRQRLRLFLQVCDAVQHAHQRLVVHRDLKPGNILVDEAGHVTLLDFGIAALLRDEPADHDATLPPTRGDARVFTPEYAAPEQLRGDRVSTATDVYALGVLLYELLTGRRPFVLSGRSPAEMERVVSHEAPLAPSEAVSRPAPAGGGSAEAPPAPRSVPPGATRTTLAGDLDAIVLMALRKEPARRYGSVEAMARDLRAFLDGRPVAARPDALGYRVGKFVRRRRLEVAAAAIAALSLVGGLVSARRAAAEAERERARAVAARDFLTTMLGAADPGALGRDVTVREVLDSAARRADTLAAQPALAAEVQTTIGDTYLGLGLFDRAVEAYARAMDLRHRVAPSGDRETARLLVKQGTAAEFEARYDAADSLFAQADTLLARTAPEDVTTRATILESRARMQAELGDLATMERMLRDVLALRRRETPDDEQQQAYTLNNLAFAVGAQGRFADADSLHDVAVATSVRAFGAEHPVTATAIAQHAHAKEMVGDVTASDSLYREAIALRRRLLGEQHPDYAWTLFQYSQFLVRRERWADALTAGREVLALRGGALPESHPAIHTALQAVGMALAGLDSLTNAERYLRESLALREATLPDGHWLVASGWSVLGAHLVRLGRYAESERLLLDAERTLVASRGAESPQAQDTVRRLVALYEAWGREEEAARWRKRLRGDG